MGQDLCSHEGAAPGRGSCYTVEKVTAWNRGSIVVRQECGGAVLSAHYARHPQIMHLLRCLFFFHAQFGFELRAQHIPGRQNTAQIPCRITALSNLALYFCVLLSSNIHPSTPAANAALILPQLDLLILAFFARELVA